MTFARIRSLAIDYAPLIAAVLLLTGLGTVGGCEVTTESLDGSGRQVSAQELEAERLKQEAQVIAAANAAVRAHDAAVRRATAAYEEAVAAADASLEAAGEQVELERATLQVEVDRRFADLEAQIALRDRVLSLARPIIDGSAASQGIPPGTTSGVWDLILPVLGVGGAGSAIVMAHRKRRSDKALTETAAGVQTLRTTADPVARQTIDEALRRAQSPATEGRIRQIKAEAGITS